MAITSDSVREIFAGLGNSDGAAFLERVRRQKQSLDQSAPAATVLGL
jgi:hypothetical protein